MMRSDVRNPDHVALPHLPSSDWQVLRDTILESLAISHDAFLTSFEQVAAKKPKFWKDKLRSAKWAVVQRDNQTLGIAAAKPPGKKDGYALAGNACFIESVWIDPELRKNGVGQRLVTYVIEQQRQAGIQEFYLWVVNDNDPAIRLYERMHFKETRRESVLPETQFLLKFDSDVVDEEELRQNSVDRADDKSHLRITYRMLSVDPPNHLLRRVWRAVRKLSGRR